MSRCGSCDIYGCEKYGVYCEGNRDEFECAEALQTLVSNLESRIKAGIGPAPFLHFTIRPDSEWVKNRVSYARYEENLAQEFGRFIQESPHYRMSEESVIVHLHHRIAIDPGCSDDVDYGDQLTSLCDNGFVYFEASSQFQKDWEAWLRRRNLWTQEPPVFPEHYCTKIARYRTFQTGGAYYLRLPGEVYHTGMTDLEMIDPEKYLDAKNRYLQSFSAEI